MAVTTTNLGFVPKGRPTIRKSTPSGRSPRFIEWWTIPEAREGTPLAKLEAAYMSAIAAVDEIEEHKAQAVKSKQFTDEGIITDALQFAASKLAPRLKRARQVVEAAKMELAARRARRIRGPPAAGGPAF